MRRRWKVAAYAKSHGESNSWAMFLSAKNYNWYTRKIAYQIAKIVYETGAIIPDLAYREKTQVKIIARLSPANLVRICCHDPGLGPSYAERRGNHLSQEQSTFQKQDFGFSGGCPLGTIGPIRGSNKGLQHTESPGYSALPC